jgi:succinate dehydrogenase / fumarate reductase iron-sulfur subunit
MVGQQTTVKIWRGDHRGGEFEEYRLIVEEGMMVLDAIHAIQAEQANDLAVRWNCKVGRCGSCSAEINGMPRLMCMTQMASLRGETTVAPLRAFPVIRDLVTDVSINYEKATRVPPFSPRRDGAEALYPEDVARIREFHNCIECFLCQNVCHVLRDHPEHEDAYAGPRFFVRFASLEMNPLDSSDRISQAMGARIDLCNVTKCCTEVCPEGIRITDNAIIPLKERIADRRNPLAGLFRPKK